MRDALHKVMNSSWWDCSQMLPNFRLPCCHTNSRKGFGLQHFIFYKYVCSQIHASMSH